MKIDRNAVKRILLITLSNLGDAILTTPVLDALYKRFPDARIDILMNPVFEDLFAHDNRVAKIFFYEKHAVSFEKYRLLKKLYNIRYDLVVDLKNTMIPLFLMPRYRTSLIRIKHEAIHKKEEHLSLIRQLGIETQGAKLGIMTNEEDADNARKILNGFVNPGKYIVMNPGAKSHVKRWPAANFAALSDRIVKELGYDVVVIGKDSGRKNPESDRVVVDNFLKLTKENVLDIVGKTNTRELFLIIGRARCIITNDSAPLHIASATGTPTVALFGPTDDRKYGPLANRSVVIRRPMPCAPCETAKCSRQYECLRDITVKDAFDAVKKIVGAYADPYSAD